MGFILTLLLICCIVSVICYFASNKDGESTICGFVASAIISAALLTIVYGMSYYSYVDLKEDVATIEQYEQEIKLYTDKAVVEFGKTPADMAMTDLKYQSYQKELSEKVNDLRVKIQYFNEGLISKRVMGNNWYFRGVIIMPDDDMKEIKMADSVARIQ